jgi:hypothetical protein
MRTMNRNRYAWIALLSTALLASGCSIFDNDDNGSNTNEQQTAEFEPLTSPENLIYNLALSYSELNIEEYAKLLLREEDGDYGREYRWHFQAEDVAVIGEEYWDRQADIEATNNLFKAASGTPLDPSHPVIDHLELEIVTSVPWSPIDSLWDEPCEDCWTTSHDYKITLGIADDYIRGIGLVELYVVPVQVGDVTEYRIALALDMPDAD